LGYAFVQEGRLPRPLFTHPSPGAITRHPLPQGARVKEAREGLNELNPLGAEAPFPLVKESFA
jgi:hypothetical protein